MTKSEKKPFTSILRGALPIDLSWSLLLLSVDQFSFCSLSSAHLLIVPPFLRRNTSLVLVSYVDETEIG